MTTEFTEPVNGFNFKSVEGFVLPDYDGKEFRYSMAHSAEDINSLGCNYY